MHGKSRLAENTKKPLHWVWCQPPGSFPKIQVSPLWLMQFFRDGTSEAEHLPSWDTWREFKDACGTSSLACACSLLKACFELLLPCEVLHTKHTEIRHLAEYLEAKRWGPSFASMCVWACWLPGLHTDLRQVLFIGLGQKKRQLRFPSKSYKFWDTPPLHAGSVSHSDNQHCVMRQLQHLGNKTAKQPKRKGQVEGKERQQKRT